VTATAEAAELLWALWRTGAAIAELPPRLRPRTVDEGWRIQRRLDEHAAPAAGWKLAATSAAGQAHIGADGPLAGRIYERCLVQSGSILDATSMRMRAAEAEFAFRLARDVSPTGAAPTRAEVLAAIGQLIPAIEVPDSRFTDFLAAGLPSMVADGLCCAFLVLGPPVRAWHEDELAGQAVVMRRNGEVVACGSGADVFGDPVAALVWLAGQLHAAGMPLRRGDVVTTGACTPAHPVAAGDELVAAFGALGEVRVRFH
jgi:2-keto-4-pentenoate hydratase